MTTKMKNTILIVDEDPDILRLAEKFLKLEGLDTITCNNAKDAMKIVEKSYDKIGLILVWYTRLGMPVIRYSVLDKLRNNEKFRNIPVESIGGRVPISGKKLVNNIKKVLRGEKVEREVHSSWTSNHHFP